MVDKPAILGHSEMDEEKIKTLVFQIVADMGSAFAMSLGYIGNQLGLFQAMHGVGPLTSGALAERTGLNERYVREWLKAMVANSYVDYDPSRDRYHLTDEQAFVLVNRDSPMYVGGAFEFTLPSILNSSRLIQCFRKGGGIPYDEIGDEVPAAIESFLRPLYRNYLTAYWLPSIPGIVEKLDSGALILDVGCGAGQSTVAMASAFPRSTVTGLDSHQPSIDKARQLALDSKLGNADFVKAQAHELPSDKKYDLICAFDCIHDMAEPVRVLRAIREALASDGVFFWDEPKGSENPLENRNIVGKSFAGISPHHCLTVSLAQGGAGLGTIIGESGARRLAEEAEFSSFERLPIKNAMKQFFVLRK